MRALLETLRRAVLEGKGQTSTAERQQVAAHCEALATDASAVSPLSAALAEWVDKVAKHAYQTLDRQVDALKESGLSEDAIFELTVSAAYGAARGRFDRALAAIEEVY